MRRAVVMGLVGLLAFSALAGVNDAGAGSKGPKVCKKALAAADDVMAKWSEWTTSQTETPPTTAPGGTPRVQDFIDDLNAEVDAVEDANELLAEVNLLLEDYSPLRNRCLKALGYKPPSN